MKNWWQGFWAKFWPYIIIFFLLITIYGQVVDFGYSGFDDTDLILGRLELFSDWGNLSLVFRSGAWLGDKSSFYRPLQNLSYMLDTHLSTNKIDQFTSLLPVFHLHNLLLFFIAISLIFYILEKIFHSPRLLAFCLTIFYATSPLFTSLATWIPARGDLQVTIFVCLCFIFFVKYLQKNTWSYLLLTALFFALALFSKEVAGVTPLVLVVYYFSFHFPFPKKQKVAKISIWRQIFTGKNISLALLFIIIALIWRYFQQAAYYLEAGTATMSLANLKKYLPTIPETLFKLLFPHNVFITSLYSPFNTFAGSILFLLLFWLTIKKMTSQGRIFYWFWFVIFTFPPLFFSTTNMTGFVDFLEHRSFLPLLGIVFLLNAFLKKLPFFQQKLTTKNLKSWWAVQNPFGKVFSFLFLLLILNASGRSWLYAQDFRQPLAFAYALFDYSPSSAAYTNLIDVKSKLGDNEGAVSLTHEALAKNLIPETRLSLVYNQLGISQGELKDFSASLISFNQALASTPSALADFSSQILINRSISLEKLGRYQEALADLDLSLSLKPESSKAASLKNQLLQKIQN